MGVQSFWFPTIAVAAKGIARRRKQFRRGGLLHQQSRGAGAPIDPLVLSQMGSVFLTRPTLAHYLATRLELLWRADDVLGWIAAGKLHVRIERAYTLYTAADAHRDLEGRKTSGKLLIIPG